MKPCQRYLNSNRGTLLITYVTVYGKTWHMGFPVKIEFDASLINSTLD